MIIMICQIASPLSLVKTYYFFYTQCNTVKTILTIPQELNPSVTESENINGSPDNGWVSYSFLKILQIHR